MKVVYESVLKALDHAIFDAAVANRRIEYIELSPAEYNEFLKEVSTRNLSGIKEMLYQGVAIKRQGAK